MTLSILAASAVLAVTPTAEAADAPRVPDVMAGSVQAASAVPAPVSASVPAADAVTPQPGAPAPAAPAPASAGSGEIVVSGHTKAPPQDPMEAINVKSFETVQKVDDAVVAPMARGYQKALPRPLRMGLRNFLSHLTEPVVALNFLLQLKPGKAAETVGRFAINSTIGIGGLIDVARSKPFHLPYRRNGLAWTLGYYGVGPGPYLFLPLVGPTTMRDLFGLTIDRAIVPFAVGKPLTSPVYVATSNVVKSLDDRIQTDAELQQMRDSNDPYGNYRQAYLRQRQAEIDALHGRKPVVEAPKVAAPPTTLAPEPVAAPVTPPAPVFVSIPVIQPIPGT